MTSSPISAASTVRRNVPDNERFGVWKAWGGKCFWCTKPVRYPDCDIDHVIPLDAVKRDGSEKLRELYGLGADFDFDSFENWVPAHAGCNRQKGATYPKPSPAVSLHLAKVEAKSKLAAATARAITKDRRKGPLLAKLSLAIREGEITKEEIEEIWAGLPSPPSPASDGGFVQFIAPEFLQVVPGWEVAQINGSLLYVKSAFSGRIGMTSTSSDPSWICSRCGNKGPWNGVICLSCGNREEPD